MPNIVTLVELHDAAPTHYAVLRNEMADLGFVNQIDTEDGEAFMLPTSMFRYGRAGNWPAAYIRDLAKSAADKTGCKSWIFTTDAKNAAWYLNTVKP